MSNDSFTESPTQLCKLKTLEKSPSVLSGGKKLHETVFSKFLTDSFKHICQYFVKKND